MKRIGMSLKQGVGGDRFAIRAPRADRRPLVAFVATLVVVLVGVL